MPTFEHTTDVAAPADRVFEFVTDTSNWLRAHAGLTDLETVAETDDETRMYATYRTLGVSNHLEMTQQIVEPVGKRYNERQFRHALETMKELMDVELAADEESMATA